jgi:hypothetical protein
MSERIKELMIQCEKQYCQDHDDYFYDMEKFAELLIRECAKTASDFVRGPGGDHGVTMVIYKHFGVEW